MDNRDQLCAAWLAAKSAETKARDLRVKIEAQLADAFDMPAEGSKTSQTDDYKVTMTQPITRKINLAEWDKVRDKVPASLQPIKVSIVADATGCKYLAEKEPKVWAKIAKAFIATPGKVGVKVEAK